ncbi:MAG: 30S ribosomal protein S12 methylthiotransferase RimO [Gemmatimonadetes bacterium]|nr:30S ribosomal protein S12 methylthiotransferase RimO [Gemmatimonadota bacterium]
MPEAGRLPEAGAHVTTGRLRTRNLPVFPVTRDPVRPQVPRDVKAVTSHIDPAGPRDGLRICLVTLGCDKNTVDSERMMAALVGHGARVSSGVEGAEVVVINTCGFIEAAKEESVETILEACALKAEGEVRAVVAVGCLVQRYKEELSQEIPEVDLFLGLTEMGRLVPELRARGLLDPDFAFVSNMELPLRILSTDTPHTSYLKISEGCDHSCAFCAIPHMRGLHRSAPVEELVREARELEARGVKELNVISQDTTWYGRDLQRAAGGPSGRRAAPGSARPPLLPDLLRALLDGTSVPWYRLFYMYPSGITREMVDLIASEPRILPYLDMPIQHGSDSVLKRMRRPERQATIRERAESLRAAIPDLVLRTTVIVGFPGETETEFGEMLELLEEVRFERVGAFPYSVEDGTPAATMGGQLSDAEKRDRLEAVMDTQREISRERNEELVGRRELLLVDRLLDEDPDFSVEGRTRGQAIEVDGVTRVVAVEGAERGLGLTPGAFVEVEIQDASEYDLMARVIG